MFDYFQSVRRDGANALSQLAILSEVNILNERNENLLHVAIAYDNDSVAREVIRRAINVNQQSSDGMTPLHYAAVYKKTEIAHLILDSGGDVAIVDKHGNSPLWTAVLNSKGNYDFVNLLLRYGASHVANVKNKYGRSPLDFAMQSDKKDLLRLLSEWISLAKLPAATQTHTSLPHRITYF